VKLNQKRDKNSLFRLIFGVPPWSSSRKKNIYFKDYHLNSANDYEMITVEHQRSQSDHYHHPQNYIELKSLFFSLTFKAGTIWSCQNGKNLSTVSFKHSVRGKTDLSNPFIYQKLALFYIYFQLFPTYKFTAYFGSFSGKSGLVKSIGGGGIS
jgi:hypothetical protein